MESILTSIKKLLGLSEDYEAFDDDIILDINSALFILWQLGVGKSTETPYMIHDDSETWTDFIDESQIEICKPYVYLRTKMLFDPPSSGTMVDAINGQIKEYEVRMTYAVDEYSNYYVE